jgi:hypothetical protein
MAHTHNNTRDRLWLCDRAQNPVLCCQQWRHRQDILQPKLPRAHSVRAPDSDAQQLTVWGMLPPSHKMSLKQQRHAATTPIPLARTCPVELWYKAEKSSASHPKLPKQGKPRAATITQQARCRPRHRPKQYYCITSVAGLALSVTLQGNPAMQCLCAINKAILWLLLHHAPKHAIPAA